MFTMTDSQWVAVDSLGQYAGWTLQDALASFD